ncbi:Protein CBG15322 [Caenorhabditis briggsae]|uniref:Protein CBG15322 n=1 Tax=Caenorhabditis briggsae TaxID=6238 RepID=A8XLX8_CAEBR|nr:Protein CBG15322 [Caenorhabditis briggsae]CAP33653.2 Protein CBG15322 [Caenorhabditis briggsae]
MDNLFDAVELMFDRDASDTQNFIGFKGTNDYLKVFEKMTRMMNSKGVHFEFYLGVEKMAEIARFKDQDLAILKKWKTEIQACFQTSKLKLSNFDTYQKEMCATEKVIRKFFEVSRDLSHLKDHLLSKATPNNNRLRYYIDLLNDVTDEIDYGLKQKLTPLEIFNWIKNRVDEVQKRVQDLEPLANLDFFETLENVAKLVKKMAEMKQSTTSTKEKLKIDENKLIEEMDLVNIANCLKQNESRLDSLEKVKTQLAPVEKSINQISNSAYSKDSKNLILSLKEAKTLSQDIGANVRILEDAERIRQNRSLLTNIPQFPEEIKFLIYRAGLAQWADPSIQLKEMLGKIEKLERISGKVRSESVLEMTKIFEEAADITGISGSWTSLNQFSIALKESHLKDKNASMNYFSDVVSLGVDFEFSNHQTRLRTSRTIVLSLVQYFDEIFGHSKPKTVTIEKHVETASLAMIIGICIGIVFVILLATLFMDQTNMKNSIQDAVREVNRTNLLLVLKNGAYVNVNKNKTDQQMIPTKYQNSDKAAEFSRIDQIYKKYSKSKYRISVPQKFPSTPFIFKWKTERITI